MRRAHHYLIFFPMFVVLALGAGCERYFADSSQVSGGNRETLTVALPEILDSLNWNESSQSSSNFVATAIMQGLTRIEVAEAETHILPDLAQSIAQSADFRRLTFKINSKAKWSDGKPVTADDFIFALQNVLNPANKKEIPQAIFNLKNARAFHDQKIENFDEVGFRPGADNSIVVNLEQGDPGFAAIFAQPLTFPMRRDLVKSFGTHWSDPEHLVTVGHYKVVRFERHKFLELVRFEKPGQEKEGLVKNVRILFGLSPREELKLFSQGKLDIIFDVSQKDLELFKDRDDFISVPLFDVTYVSIDVRAKPLSNPIFRRAIGMAIDRNEVIRAVGGGQISIGEMIPPGLVGFESNRGVRFDSDAANELLKHSGYGNIGTIKIKMVEPKEDEGKLAARSVRAQLKKNIGLEVELVDSETDDPHILLSHLHSFTPSPAAFLKIFKSHSGDNVTGWKNRKYDDFLDEAETSSSQENREKLFAKAQHILNDEEMPVIPLFVDSYGILIQKRVKDFPVNGFKLGPLQGVTLE